MRPVGVLRSNTEAVELTLSLDTLLNQLAVARKNIETEGEEGINR